MATDDLHEMLDIEIIDSDLYRAQTFAGVVPPYLYGGEVAAQALRAASFTVSPERRPHSLHGYFLRRGRSGSPIVLQIYRDRDGRSFSSRRVLAIQDGEVLFSAAASFQVDEPSPEYQLPMPSDVPLPDAIALDGAHGGPPQFFEIRRVPGPAGEQQTVSNQMWVRCRVDLGDDPVLQACALVYVSDFGSGFAELGIEGLAQGGASLDHCVWFHRPIRLDDWVLVNLWPLRASGSRGTYMGTIHDLSGALGAVLTQEALLRLPPH